MALEVLLSSVRARGAITAQDTLDARRVIYGAEGVVSSEGADALISLNDCVHDQAPEWRDLFIEAILDFVVYQKEPSGFVDEAAADWLMTAVARDRRLRADELEVMLEVLEKAEQTPARFASFVLRVLLERAHGLISAGQPVGAAEVARLRRAVFACGSDGNVGVTRAEAEALFDLDDALQGATVDPSWTDFFARAVGAAVLFTPTWRPDRDAEMARETWLKDKALAPHRTLADLQAGAAEGVRELVRFDFENHDMEQGYAADDAAEAVAERLSAEEFRWLKGLVGRSGQVSPAARALLAFIAREARVVDPAFRVWLAELGVRPDDAPSDAGAGAARSSGAAPFGQRGPTAA